MTSIGNKVINILIVCTLLLSGSCTPGSCFEETNAYVKASFYLETTGKLSAPDSLTLYGIGIDSIRYKKASRVQPALIPLNAADEKCGFVIRINGINDTLSFFYSTYTHLISKECGYTFYHDLDSVYSTRHNIDSLIIKLRSVTTIDAPNIYIYY